MNACSTACGHCGGCTTEWERDDDDTDDTEVCPDCLGSGEVIREDGSEFQTIAECRECGGKGWIR